MPQVRIVLFVVFAFTGRFAKASLRRHMRLKHKIDVDSMSVRGR